MRECFFTRTSRNRSGSRPAGGLTIGNGYDDEAFSDRKLPQSSAFITQISAAVHNPFRAGKMISSAPYSADKPADACADADAANVAHTYSGSGISQFRQRIMNRSRGSAATSVGALLRRRTSRQHQLLTPAARFDPLASSIPTE